MSKRRTAERAVIEAATEWRSATQDDTDASFSRTTDAVFRMLDAVDALAALDLEPATATRTISLPLATSEAAAAYMSKRVHNVVGLVFREILLGSHMGAIGFTTDAIEVRLGRSHQSVSPRVTDLRDQGWIEDSGFTRATRYGQQAVVWKPTAAALVAVEGVPDWSW